MEYKRCSSCIPGALTGYYQPGQLNPGFLASLLLLPLLLFHPGLGPAKAEFMYSVIYNIVLAVQEIKRYNAGASPRITVIDCGLKQNQVRCLVNTGAAVTVVPWNHSLQMEDHGLQVSHLSLLNPVLWLCHPTQSDNLQRWSIDELILKGDVTYNISTVELPPCKGQHLIAELKCPLGRGVLLPESC
ncbi:CAD [Cordylochernes scorpioides]|uniref:CAD n=1 Tax=Cordylochernes scorpioides TaxID=51811 RepID=A0ABY6KLT3_9ARAC|nr:CAD [Cordylochernes scorpioides]